MRVLLDSTVLMEGERRRFDLGAWARQNRHEILICDAGVTEYLEGLTVATVDTNHYDDLGIPAFNPLKDPTGKRGG